MKKFIDMMVKESEKNSTSELTLKTLEIISNNKSDYICLLEGETDELFYSNINHPFFVNHSIKYIYSAYVKSIENKSCGKTAVIETCNIVLTKINKEKFKKCVFIVDHDYDGLEKYKRVYSKTCLDAITMLPVYSFENYFLLDENLKGILSKWLSYSQHESFWDEYNSFIEKYVKYCTYKSVVTRFHDQISYKKSHDEKKIFYFDFRGNQKFDFKLMEDEIRCMKEAVSFYPNLSDEIIITDKRLMNRHELLKGKVLFNFLKYYLIDKEKSYALMGNTQDYSDVVNHLKVELNVKIN